MTGMIEGFFGLEIFNLRSQAQSGWGAGGHDSKSAWYLEGCVPFGESKNGFLILDLPDFAVERNVKSEIGFVTLVTFRQRVQYARQPLKSKKAYRQLVGTLFRK